jgi:Co/Zn/Cd efflux system component
VAALAVWWLGSGWPDILVGVALSGLVLESSASVLRGAVTTLPVAHA